MRGPDKPGAKPEKMEKPCSLNELDANGQAPSLSDRASQGNGSGAPAALRYCNTTHRQSPLRRITILATGLKRGRLLRRRTLGYSHQILRTHPLLKRVLHLGGCELDVAACRNRGLIERQIELPTFNQPMRDAIDARLRQWDPTQQQRLDPQQLIATDHRALHAPELLHRDVRGLADILRITGVLDEIRATGSTGLQRRPD